MNIQPIFDLVQICHLKGIKQAVISPGSRNAALTVAFSRHPDIQCFSVPDERSAAFIALGMSLKSQLPTVLICTSGSAALNYAPAVSEAFFNQVPLLILSADRPPEWIGQRDGQTIYQENLFGRHVKGSFAFPSLDESDESESLRNKMAANAIDLCMSNEYGPVHINIPFREPFYPSPASEYAFYQNLKVQEREKEEKDNNWKKHFSSLHKFKKILIVKGQSSHDQSVNQCLNQLSDTYNIPVVADLISNAHDVNQVITTQDLFLRDYNNDNLQPDLLITIGMSVISKNLKLYLRKFKPTAHWHVRRENFAPDTYQALTDHLQIDEKTFLTALENELSNCPENNYFDTWQKINQQTKKHIELYNGQKFSDFYGYKKILQILPSGSDLHLANSMAVRYANVIGLNKNQEIEVYCNRGTSGIDGSNSTALGSALMSDKPTYLISGDMAFLYDRNAFWHNHVPNNLGIIIFNNQGGGIFRMIEGPSQQDELEEFFETKQKRNAELLAHEYGFEYYSCKNEMELDENLNSFINDEKPKILEIFTDAETSKTVYKELFRSLVN